MGKTFNKPSLSALRPRNVQQRSVHSEIGFLEALSSDDVLNGTVAVHLNPNNKLNLQITEGSPHIVLDDRCDAVALHVTGQASPTVTMTESVSAAVTVDATASPIIKAQDQAKPLLYVSGQSTTEIIADSSADITVESSGTSNHSVRVNDQASLTLLVSKEAKADVRVNDKATVNAVYDNPEAVCVILHGNPTVNIAAYGTTKCKGCGGEGWWTDTIPDGHGEPMPVQAPCECHSGKAFMAGQKVKPGLILNRRPDYEVPF